MYTVNVLSRFRPKLAVGRVTDDEVVHVEDERSPLSFPENSIES